MIKKHCDICDMVEDVETRPYKTGELRLPTGELEDSWICFDLCQRCELAAIKLALAGEIGKNGKKIAEEISKSIKVCEGEI